MRKKGHKVNNSAQAQLRKIAKSNPEVDARIVSESISLVSYLRSIGLKGSGFNILRSSESNLKLKPPILHEIDQ
jgi:hypothetical protein